ncbi:MULTISPECIES: hypothetical protein [Pseudomonas]|uniref:Uncharacterized protein n=1 Tax=Pseudomonas glycinae TaxID=1785145 RepID=A0ABN4MNZ9_9PSED|nr:MULTISPECIES: hypothetical protein [Pseudomonas]AMQ83353.1 hypothetical protein AWU82_08555 [Pseudomonas glycinae]NKF27243.1 hypothetical protein [Pseudomonas sp. BG5]
MSESDNKLNMIYIFYMLDSKISLISLDNKKPKVLKGKLRSVNSKLRTLELESENNIRKIVNLDDIQKVNYEEINDRAFIVSEFNFDTSRNFSPPDLNDVRHASSTPTQTSPVFEPQFTSTSNIVIIKKQTDSCVYTWDKAPFMDPFFLLMRALKNPFVLVLS